MPLEGSILPIDNVLSELWNAGLVVSSECNAEMKVTNAHTERCSSLGVQYLPHHPGLLKRQKGILREPLYTWAALTVTELYFH